MPRPLPWTQTRAKFPRAARQATSPSSSSTTRDPPPARPQAIAVPTSPPPTTRTSQISLIARAAALLPADQPVDPHDPRQGQKDDQGDDHEAGGDGSQRRIERRPLQRGVDLDRQGHHG